MEGWEKGVSYGFGAASQQETADEKQRAKASGSL